MNEFDKSYKKDVTAVNKRRNFLKKSATGAVIVSLPAKSVWGACTVSGTVSGNLSQQANNHTCTLPDLMGEGRSPGGWLNWQSNMHSIFDELATMKSNIANNSTRQAAYDSKKDEYSQVVESVMAHLLIMPGELGGTSMTVGSALSTTGQSRIYSHCAAAYLNAYFELYAGYSYGDRVSAHSLAERIYIFNYIQKEAGNDPVLDSALRYYDGTTAWEVS